MTLHLSDINARSVSYLDEIRLTALLDEALRQAERDEGDFAEFGVFKAGSAAVIGAAMQHQGSKRSLHLFDSWIGFPETSSHDPDRLGAGMLATPKDEAVALLDGAGVLDRCVFHDGFFEETLSQLTEPIGFAHVDCDLYGGTVQVLQHLFPLMTPGATIIVDDYSERFSGVITAVHEVLPDGWSIRVLGGVPDASAILERVGTTS